MIDALELLRTRGHDAYGGERVSQLEHALQAAAAAEAADEPAAMIVAALLHDVGHLLAKSISGRDDDRHEAIGASALRGTFDDDVTGPILLHVAAKRYLVGAQPEYERSLSEESIRSLAAQGGPMGVTERAAFELEHYAQDAVRLRRYDDEAKVVGRSTPPLEHFARLVRELARD